MSEVVNRNGFPKSGNFLSFLKMFVSLDPSQRKNVFINHSETPGIFNYCVFPSAVTLPPECAQLLRTAEAVAVMVYSFARVSAVVSMNVCDYYGNGKTWWLRLHEKGGKFHEVPAHHKAEEYLDAYIAAAGIASEGKLPLFRAAIGRTNCLSRTRLHRLNALQVVKRRARRLGLPAGTCCHTFRATGITAYLGNGGTIEHAQAIAAHESPRTTKLYDRTSDKLALDEIERIVI